MKRIFFLASLPAIAASTLLVPFASSNKLAFAITPDFGNDVFIDWIAFSPVPSSPTVAFSNDKSEDTSTIFSDWTAFGNDEFVDWVA